jgi:hypothetical protein
VNFERVQRVFGSLSLPEESGRWEMISRGGRDSRLTFSFPKTLLASKGANPVATVFPEIGVILCTPHWSLDPNCQYELDLIGQKIEIDNFPKFY